MRPISPVGPICLATLCVIATAAPAADVTWDTIMPLTTNSAGQITGYSGQHSVAVDASGDVHVAWLDQRSVPYQIRYRRYDAATSTWLAETTLTTQQANCSQPGLGCDSAGNVHVAWQVCNWNPLGVGTWAKRYNATTHHWRADTLIDSTSTSQPQQYPSVACVPGSGDLEVGFYKLPDTGLYTQVFLRERHPSTGWDSVVQVSSAAVSHDHVSVAAAADGDLAAAWVGRDFGGDYNQICCRRRVDAVWQSQELVSNIATGLTQYSPCVAFDRRGALHVVWYGRSMMNTYQQVFHRECGYEGWSGIDSVSGERPSQQQYPSVACDAAGRVHVVWCGQTSGANTQLMYAQRDTDGVWSSPAFLTSLDSGTVSYPSLVCDGGSGIHIVWYDDHTGNQDVYYLHGTTPGAAVAEPRLLPRAPYHTPAATFVRGVLFVTESPDASPRPQDASLLDVSGRKAMDLRPGANDVRSLAPGVYFVREASRASSLKPQAVSKIVVTR